MNFAFLHGGGQGGWVWAEVIAILQEAGANCLALDVPGCGEKRGRDTSALKVSDIVAELVADIRQSGMTDVTLIGHSQAGTIMPAIAAQGQERLRRLVYLACSFPLPHQSVATMMGQGLHGTHDDQVGWALDRSVAGKDSLYRVMFCNDMDDAQTAAFMIRPHRDNWPMDANVATGWTYQPPALVPSTYLLCERDMALPPEWQCRFAERFHCERIVTIDAGHQAMTTQPEAVAAILLADAAT